MSPFTVTVRLAGINDSNVNYTGRVEVLYKGKWGKICRDEWDMNDVKVVCRQLGFRSALAEFIGIDTKEANLSVVMSKVNCDGTEPDWESCKRGDDNCVDDTGAQAMCEPSKLATEIS
ncbi:galectin-3-binding protein B-like [Acropora muricata]|uniref:galectin-3-binding protein B-like n=1 Tax=Acropora muricata TaxID=159855 RepID=UPI0034E54E6E